MLEEAKRAAVRLAIDDQERAGLDVVTDGEQTRESFVAHFYRLGGIDTNCKQPLQRTRPDLATVEFKESFDARRSVGYPTVTGPIQHDAPLLLDEVRFAARYARKPLKTTLVGPFTLAGCLVDAYYGDTNKLVEALADALNAELRELDREGLAVIQLDEPDLHFRYSEAERLGAVEWLNRTVRGVQTPVAVHMCYGYSAWVERKRVNPTYARALELVARSNVAQISLEYEEPGHEPELLGHVGDKIAAVGMLSMGNCEPESVEHIVERASAAAVVVPPERLKLSSDCGMWFLDHELAYAKIANLACAARQLRGRLNG